MTKTKKADGFTIHISDYQRAQFIEALSSAAVRDLEGAARERINERIDAEVAKRVTDALEDIVTIRLEKTVDQMLSEGWVSTDKWGNEKKRLSTRERISEFFDGRESSYSDSPTRLQKIVSDRIEAAMKTDLDIELVRVRKAFREQVDGVLQAKLMDALRAALGLSK